MARKPRIHYPGALYHVIARGNNKENIFHEKKDKQKYLDLLKKYLDKYHFLLYAYVLMDNHLHLLIEVQDTTLSKIMQGLQLSYTQYFNVKYGRVGHVFQQRYKAFLCNKDEYLFTLIKYIHFNPVKAGFSESLDYEWSSHKEYKGLNNEFVSTGMILSLFDDNPYKAVQRYLHFIQNSQEDNLQENYYLLEYQPEVSKIEQVKGLNVEVSMEELLIRIADKNNISVDLIKKKSKIPNIARARRILLYILISGGLLTRTQVAEYLGLSLSAVTRAFNDIEQDDKIKIEINELMEEIITKRK